MLDGKKSDSTGFYGLRGIFFPIYNHEMVRFFFMTALMACLLFSYTTVRIIKDTAFINAPGSGGQAVGFAKVYVVLPLSAILATTIAYLNPILSRRNLIVSMIGFFGLIFFIYAHFLFEKIPELNLDQDQIIALQESYPKFLEQFIVLYGNWATVLLYAAADTSGNILLTYGFWAIAGQLTDPKESRRIYPLYATYGNITGILFAGVTGKLLRKSGLDQTALTCARLYMVSAALLLAIFIYLSIYYFVLENEEREVPPKAKKKRVSLIEGCRAVFSSKYIACLAVMVIGYGMSINLVELTWKQCIKMRYGGDAGKFMAFFDDMYTLMGLVTFVLGLIGTRITRKIGWLATALATPTAMIVSMGAFFGYVLFNYNTLLNPGEILVNNKTSGALALMLTDPAFGAVIVGGIQNLFGKGTKYTFFDTSLQMTYIPLDEDIRATGKASVDIVAGRLGKSGGSAIQSTLVMVTGWSQLALAPILASITGVILFAWFIAVIILNREYNALLQKKSDAK